MSEPRHQPLTADQVEQVIRRALAPNPEERFPDATALADALESATGDGVREPSARLLQRLNALQDNVRAWLPDAKALSVADVVRLTATDTMATDTMSTDTTGTLTTTDTSATVSCMHDDSTMDSAATSSTGDARRRFTVEHNFNHSEFIAGTDA